MNLKKEVPLVSVCIPVFNSAAYIEEALNSAVVQTYPNIEIIISDNDSADDTVKVSESFLINKDFKNYSIFSHPQYGLVNNWNFCISQAKGKYIKFLFYDDLLEPTCIEEMVNLAEQDNEIGMVFSPRKLLFSKNIPLTSQNEYRNIEDIYKYWTNLKTVQSGQSLLNDPNLLEYSINKIGEPSTVLINKLVFKKVGLFDIDLPQLVDLEMWFRIMSQFKVGFINKVLSYFRIHLDQVTQQNTRDNFLIFIDYAIFCRKIYTADIYPEKAKLAAFNKFNEVCIRDRGLVKRFCDQFNLQNPNDFLTKYQKIFFPLVSICVPTYNGSRYLRETLDSVLSQTYQNIEIIISDDLSSDETIKIAKLYQKRLKVPFYIFEHERYGIGQNWNFAISQANGKYIKLLMQDDLLESTCIEELVNLAEQDEEIGLVFSPRKLIVSDGAENDPVCREILSGCKDLHLNWSNLKPIQSGLDLVNDPNWLNHPFNKIGEPTVTLIKKEVFEKIGLFDAQFHQLIDVEMWFRIMGYYKVGFVSKTLSNFRLHPNQASKNNRENNQAMLDFYRLYVKMAYHPFYNFIPQNIKAALENVANKAMQTHPKLYDELINSDSTTPMVLTNAKEVENPLVSICIPVYNGEKFLSDTLDSVLAQTYNNIEIILSDDNSNDNSLEIAKKYQTKSNCNFVILLHKPYGMVQNWNFCLEHAKGKYIKFLHQDDVLEPDCIEKMVALAEQDNEIGLVFSPRGIIASNEAQNDPICQADIQHSKNLYTAWQNLQSIQDGQTLLLAPNIIENPINKIGEPTTVLIRKEVFDNIGFFDTELCQLVDVEMWFRIMSQYKIGFVDQILSHWRIHSQQQTRSNSKNRERILLDWQKFYQKIFENEIYPTQLREKVALVLGYTTNSSNQEGLLSKPQNVAQQWLEISEENLESAFGDELGNKHRELLASGIKQLLLSNEEKQFIIELNQYIAKGWKQDKIAQYFLAASLYCYPHQLPERWFEDAEVPEFLVDYFVNFMFETPSFFKELGEADQHYQYVKDWVNFLHLCITTETDSPIWQQMAWIFTQRANFIPLYFNSHNLKEIYVKRAEIMEIALKQCGFQIDFNFPKRDQNRKKIRVGFLSNHFTPLTETFSTLPAFEYLDRGFEVVLYANIVSGHSLEKYSESRVDRLVQLPEDLNAKAQTIRQDDLDFLFICTNTTAVTNQITILALHKLARVQIATFNSPVTTGMKNIDYYLTGKLTEFKNSEHYSENLLFLNGQGYCFNYGDFDPKPTQTFTRQLFDLKEEQTIFISAANFYKLTPELKETWVKVIAQVPNSILILMPFGQSWSNQYPKEALVKSLHLLFEKYTISIDRLKLFDPLPNRIEVREALKIADVYLDSYPYSGTTSLIEPLEIGLPSVVRKGNTLRNRMGAAMLQSIHLSDLVVENEESYINLAVKLGTDEKLRSQYREQILEKMANNPPFLDSRSYSTQIGDVLKQLFEKHL